MQADSCQHHRLRGPKPPKLRLTYAWDKELGRAGYTLLQSIGVDYDKVGVWRTSRRLATNKIMSRQTQGGARTGLSESKAVP